MVLLKNVSDAPRYVPLAQREIAPGDVVEAADSWLERNQPAIWQVVEDEPEMPPKAKRRK